MGSSFKLVATASTDSGRHRLYRRQAPESSFSAIINRWAGGPVSMAAREYAVSRLNLIGNQSAITCPTGTCTLSTQQLIIAAHGPAVDSTWKILSCALGHATSWPDSFVCCRGSVTGLLMVSVSNEFNCTQNGGLIWLDALLTMMAGARSFLQCVIQGGEVTLSGHVYINANTSAHATQTSFYRSAFNFTHAIVELVSGQFDFGDPPAGESLNTVTNTLITGSSAASFYISSGVSFGPGAVFNAPQSTILPIDGNRKCVFVRCGLNATPSA